MSISSAFPQIFRGRPPPLEYLEYWEFAVSIECLYILLQLASETPIFWLTSLLVIPSFFSMVSSSRFDSDILGFVCFSSSSMFILRIKINKDKKTTSFNSSVLKRTLRLYQKKFLTLLLIFLFVKGLKRKRKRGENISKLLILSYFLKSSLHIIEKN